MQRPFQTVIAALIIVTCSTAFIRADDKSDIKTAGKAFIEAMKAGDMTAAKQHAVTDEKSVKFLDTLGSLTAAKKKLLNASESKFGDEGKSIVNSGSGLGNAMQMGHNFENADVEVKGETAVVTPKEGPAKPVKFKRQGGEWKVDFTDIAHDDQMERSVPLMQKMATAMNETAGEISDDKYKTVQEAKMAFRLKLVQAMGLTEGAGGPRGPGAKPKTPKSE